MVDDGDDDVEERRACEKQDQNAYLMSKLLSIHMKLEDIQKAISEAGRHWEAEDNPIQRLSDEEKKFELSRKHVAKIYNELRKGYSVLEIYRSETGKETQYIPKGIR
jgi:predicted patatin/cPLA2 family phospholipase